jgi:O-antigen/teichoic acid export membrane protein
LGLYKNLFKQTAIYGIATVLPRMFTFFLVPLYTKVLSNSQYGEVSVQFAYLSVFNVVLAYGMETAFFRFYNTETNKQAVTTTASISIFWSSLLFLFVGLLCRKTIAGWVNMDVQYVTYSIWILVLDALVIIPFAQLRIQQKSIYYAIIKIGNVLVNLLLNIFFLIVLPKIVHSNPTGFWPFFYIEDFQVGYVFVSNVAASLLTFLVLSPSYFGVKWQFDKKLWISMLRYAFPVLIAGIAFAINEHFDKIMLQEMLPKNVAKEQVGAYAACYKLGLFMVLYRTAYTLGIEPFFFSHAANEDAPKTYATITKYFVILGSLILLVVIVFADIFKALMIQKTSFWSAMEIVPLIILANFFLGIYTNLSVWYKLTNQTKIGAYISLVGAAITLIINFILIPKIGYYGSAIATIAAYGAMMILSYHLGKKYYPIPYEKNKIFGYLSISIGFSALSFYVFRENYIIGISFISLLLAYIYFNEKQTILNLIKSTKK